MDFHCLFFFLQLVLNYSSLQENQLLVLMMNEKLLKAVYILPKTSETAKNSISFFFFFWFQPSYVTTSLAESIHKATDKEVLTVCFSQLVPWRGWKTGLWTTSLSRAAGSFYYCHFYLRSDSPVCISLALDEFLFCTQRGMADWLSAEDPMYVDWNVSDGRRGREYPQLCISVSFGSRI